MNLGSSRMNVDAPYRLLDNLPWRNAWAEQGPGQKLGRTKKTGPCPFSIGYNGRVNRRIQPKILITLGQGQLGKAISDSKSQLFSI